MLSAIIEISRSLGCFSAIDVKEQKKRGPEGPLAEMSIHIDTQKGAGYRVAELPDPFGVFDVGVIVLISLISAGRNGASRLVDG